MPGVVVVVVVTDSSQLMTVCPYRVGWCLFLSASVLSLCLETHTEDQI